MATYGEKKMVVMITEIGRKNGQMAVFEGGYDEKVKSKLEADDREKKLKGRENSIAPGSASWYLYGNRGSYGKIFVENNFSFEVDNLFEEIHLDGNMLVVSDSLVFTMQAEEIHLLCHLGIFLVFLAEHGQFRMEKKRTCLLR